MVNFVYKYKFCGLPNGVSIPPRFAAIFCIIKVNVIYFCLPVDDNTKYPSGKNVKSAISLAINIDPKKVIYTSARMLARVVLKSRTIFLASAVKNLIFLSAQTTASTQKRQVSVFQSKYSKYFSSGGTIQLVITAASVAIQSTAFFLRNAAVLCNSSLW